MKGNWLTPIPFSFCIWRPLSILANIYSFCRRKGALLKKNKKQFEKNKKYKIDFVPLPIA